MSRMIRAGQAVCLALLLFAFDAPARLIPTAPVNAWPVIPAVQKRSARHVVVLELVSYGAACLDCVPRLMRVVIHDSQGIEGPRDVTPGGTPGNIMAAAAWEGTDGTIRLLLYGNVDAGGHASPNANVLFSPDGGSTWAVVAVPAGSQLAEAGLSGGDFGGPVAASVSSPIRLGTPDVPFVLSIANPTTGGLWGVRADGSGFLLTPTWGGALLGSDAGGTRFLVAALLFASPLTPYQPTSWKVAVMDLSGNLQQLFEIPPDAYPWMEGWITPDGSAYLNVDWSVLPGPAQHPQPLPSTHSLTLWKGGTVQEIVTAQSRASLFAVPNADFSHAWIVTTDAGATTLESHTPSGGFVESWRDASGPPISALFAADSGERLLVQTARSRQAPGIQGLGLAVWSLGQSAPGGYDEIILNAPGPPTFVHLDVDAVESGAPMLIDPGSPQNIGGPSGLMSPGSPNLFQTQSLVRASLRQQLVIPAVARAPGLDGSNWRTDVILRNPGTSPLQVTARLLANPATTSQPADANLTLGPGTITVLPDVLKGLFQLEQGSGALLLIPDASGTMEATSRTYTASGNGTYGMALDAEDVIAGARPGFEQTFSAGLLGSGFRTNFVASDLSGQGSQLQLFPQSAGGTVGAPLSVIAPPAKQTQLNGLAALTDTPGSQSAAFYATCSAGSVVTGLIAIDDATNDPTWFGPDTPPGQLTIPAIVHASGANGAEYWTDLFLFNPDPISHFLSLAATLWDQAEGKWNVTITLAPGESRQVSDALLTLFGWSGVARLDVQSGFPNGRVLVTSRTYTVREDGSTYGMLVPPLDAAQTATAGETLEILGPTGASSSRTNLALVSVAGYSPASVHVQILDDKGSLLDSFDQTVPPENGLQLNDLFRARGLGDGPKAALIRLSPSSGILAAYATTIDNATNDPVYFAGNLAP
jgi:hypothetical protein